MHLIAMRQTRTEGQPKRPTGFVPLALAILISSVVSLAAAGWAVAQSKQADGTFAVTATSAALGVGWSWGHGILTLNDGSQHKFKVSGLDVVAVGFKKATASGKVYNLKNVADFEGQYVAATAGITVGGGANAASLKNDRGVVMNVGSTSQGVDFRLAASGITVKLAK